METLVDIARGSERGPRYHTGPLTVPWGLRHAGYCTKPTAQAFASSRGQSPVGPKLTLPVPLR